jgi:hypothetical protein
MVSSSDGVACPETRRWRRSSAWPLLQLLLVGVVVGSLTLPGLTPAADAAKRRTFAVSAKVVQQPVVVGQAIRLKGSVKPARSGQRVKVQHRSGTRWQTIARPRLDKASGYAVRTVARGPGVHKYRVVKPATPNVRRGISKTVRVRVTARSAPAAQDGWLDVSAAGASGCGIRDDRTLWCWGEAPDSDGWGSRVNETPRQVGAARAWADVEVGVDHSCAIRVNGSAWCWGSNPYGQLGTPGPGLELLPVRVVATGRWTKVEPGLNGSCGLKSTGTLWCWGLSSAGYPGDDGDAPHLPRQVGADTDWASVSTGAGHSCATKGDGTAWCWGNNWAGALGDGTTETRTTPTRVAGGGTWRSLSAGHDFTCGVRPSGAAECWGENYQGQVGDGTEEPRSTPQQVVGGGSWRATSTGEEWSCGVRANGSLWCWGKAYEAAPVRVGAATSWRSVDLGRAHACALRADGTAWCFGENYYAQLGDGTRTTRPTPVRVAPTLA